ncbi:MAG: EAL domain-containing protein [Candidatus Dormibacteria bacterium]
MADRIRVLIADDQPDLRTALSEMIASDDGLQVVAVATDAAQAADMARRERPDVAVLDVRMPGGGGVAAAQAIRRIAPEVHVLAFSAHGDRETVFEMLKAGAVGYLVKGSSREVVLSGIHDAAASRSVLSPEVAVEVVGALTNQLRLTDVEQQRVRDRRERIQHAIRGSSMHMVFQPIVAMASRRLLGYESLARFDSAPIRGPEQWFAEADQAGLMQELELHAIELAIEAFRDRDPGLVLSVNASPATLLGTGLHRVLQGAGRRVAVEITEHAPVFDYEALRASVDRLRVDGHLLAIDDVGSGYASLRHILQLRPEVIKLDISLVRGIDRDVALQALASAFIAFAAKIGINVLAEGIETLQEAAACRTLGVGYAQGYLYGAPEALETITELSAATSS